MSPIERGSSGILLTVRVTPRSGRDGPIGIAAGADGRPLALVRLSAPPVDGAANDALVAVVAKALGVAKRDVRIAAGAKSRVKRIAIDGPADELAARAAAWLGLQR